MSGGGARSSRSTGSAGAEIHVREEYGLGGRHRFYVMTASERLSDTADFIDLDGLNFN